MAQPLKRGDVWLYRFGHPNKQRPVVILSRPAVIPLLHSVIVAPISSAIHGIPSEVVLGVEQGMKHTCAVNLDNIQTVSKAGLAKHVTTLDRGVMATICEALAHAVACRR